MKILLIESNTYIAKSIVINFEDTNAKITHRDSIENIDEEFYTNDICILDNTICNSYLEHTLNTIKHIKLINENIHIIISIEHAKTEDIFRYFEAGCIDYIQKPFYIEELETRIYKALNRSKKEKIKICDNIFYNFVKSELFIDKKATYVRKKEKRLLEYFLKKPNQELSSEEIAAYVWEENQKETNNLRQLISSLKRIIRCKKEIIEPVYGYGYKFILS